MKSNIEILRRAMNIEEVKNYVLSSVTTHDLKEFAETLFRENAAKDDDVIEFRIHEGSNPHKWVFVTIQKNATIMVFEGAAEPSLIINFGGVGVFHDIFTKGEDGRYELASGPSNTSDCPELLRKYVAGWKLFGETLEIKSISGKGYRNMFTSLLEDWDSKFSPDYVPEGE